MNNPQQPREYDAVLGGNSPSLEGAAVLGGIEGVKLRLQNPDLKVRIAALEQALNYGEQGLDLVITGLNDQSWDIQNAAYLILSDRTEPRIKQILQKPNQQGLKLEQIEVVTVDKFGEIIQRQQRVARYFIEDLGNGVNLEMAAIPGGTFMMGSPENEAKRRHSENPQHQVTVPGFFMGKYPVTQAQYQAVMGTNPSYFNGSNRPVESVSWNDAVKFCELLSQRTGKKYTLPSEAQWEYACRAGTTTPFYFGETITTDLANYDGNYTYASAPRGEYRRQTTDVGSFPPNAFGLYDMHGNVSEWCFDDWVDNYNNAPTDSSAVTRLSNEKLLRWGSWFDHPGNCRSVCRFYADAGFGDDFNGFRVVCGAARTL
ncbi:Sulphatase-modifying factor protein [Cuspidothrix issatschenkoi CHARLIE-1]|uniref:Sulphatase-modifying factor protein n=1 Tax=Cuspidothrix issatschenkoi CHARLIE-1 TaxID=2052836 RepID=A0A2S6CUU9_9CYAN|nr:Sulphatase-modifying factor protein [Cuspidothrix issatschenkoi CHARLIE-1]